MAGETNGPALPQPPRHSCMVCDAPTSIPIEKRILSAILFGAMSGVTGVLHALCARCRAGAIGFVDHHLAEHVKAIQAAQSSVQLVRP